MLERGVFFEKFAWGLSFLNVWFSLVEKEITNYLKRCLCGLNTPLVFNTAGELSYIFLLIVLICSEDNIIITVIS